MSHAHVCDECKTVAPIGEAVGWWRMTNIEGIAYFGAKSEYHFCSWRCASIYTTRHVERMAALRSDQ